MIRQSSGDSHRQVAVVMLGATGAVGSRAAFALAAMPQVRRLSLLGRRPLIDDSAGGLLAAQPIEVEQHTADIHEPASYRAVLPGHDVAICTLGVGQPSKVSREQYVRVDKDAVLAFARACAAADVRHFQLLGSVGADSSSRSFFLRTKGELEDGLRALDFERLSLFQPSMILTPTNRYGLSQAITLKVWPLLGPLMIGPLTRYRGIPVERLGQAFARNVLTDGEAEEILQWPEIMALSN